LAEFRYQLAFYEIDPWGSEREDYRNGIEAMMPTDWIIERANPGLIDMTAEETDAQVDATLNAMAAAA
jgi:hypothetical protein